MEIFFSIITRQVICRSSLTSVQDLITAIENFIDGWNDHRCVVIRGHLRSSYAKCRT